MFYFKRLKSLVVFIIFVYDRSFELEEFFILNSYGTWGYLGTGGSPVLCSYLNAMNAANRLIKLCNYRKQDMYVS